MPKKVRSLTIKEFPQDDDRMWRIEWLDGLELNPSLSTEPCVRVVLRPLHEGPNRQPEAGQVVKTPETRTALVGVGQLPVLRAGSVWVKGQIQENHSGLKLNLKGVEISAKTVALDGWEPKAFLRLIAPRFYGLWRAERPRLLVVQLGTPIQVEGMKYSQVLFPTFEVIRFYYGRSTRLAHAVFGGGYRDGFNKVIDDAVTSRNEEAGEVYIKVRTGFSRPDGWTIARMRFSKEAELGGRMIADSVLQDAVQNRIPQPKTSFPFTGTTDLSVCAKRIQGHDEIWRLLVLSIVSCSAPFPYQELTVDLANDGRPGNEEPTGNEEPVGWTPANPPVLGPDGEIELNSVEGGNTEFQPLRLESPSTEFLALAGKKIRVPEKERTHYASGKWALLNEPGSDGLSTGPDGGSGSRSGLGLLEEPHLEVEHNSRRQSALPGGIGNLKGLVGALNALEGCFAETRPPVPTLTEFLPLTSPAGRAQWAYLNSSERWGRRALIVDLSVGACVLSLIEFQWRKGESACLGIVGSSDGSRLSDSQLATVLSILSQAEGNWASVALTLDGVLRIGGYKHTWRSYEIGAGRIVERLRRNRFLLEFD
jgi:hypothetical protein